MKKYYKGIEELTEQEALEQATYHVVGKIKYHDIEVVSNGERFFALEKWNGERWTAFECYDKNGIEVDGSNKEYEFQEILATEDEEEFELIGYSLL